ncbi:MAG: VWA domain-containing protein [Planctomycetes bacterium]|nr:VWA domain-containing protein [Planctomycetota bacterium]
MYPLEQIFLWGLLAVAIPILIHLLNRQKATVVDWGAMRFLLESLTSRSRRILIEEIILMALRCLIVALAALAMARLFVPTRSVIPWAIVLPAMLTAAVCAGIAAAVWSSHRARWALLAAATVLFGGSVAATVVENYLQSRQWSLSGGERDVAILIDGSTSMNVAVDGQTNFKRAIDEARAVIEACRPADAVSIIVAGPVPRPVMASPTADRKELEAALKKLAPTGGSMRVARALAAAGASLGQGHNPAKKIVLVTDGQNVGWDLRNESQWQFVAAGLQEFPVPPQVVCRTLRLPKTLRNVALADIRFSRKVIGTDRPVRIDVTAANAGTTVAEPLSIELAVDGAAVARQETAEMLPGASETVRFDHRFGRPGLHVVAATVLSEDEMPADNAAVRVLEAIDKMPVLVVEGDPSTRPLDGAAAFIEIALAPLEDEPPEEPRPAEPPPPPPPAGKPAGKPAEKAKDAGPRPEERLGRLVALTTVPAPEITAVKDFHKYNLVVLANVPQLPQAAAAALKAFVQDGGGLLIVPGDKVVPAFYNAWMSDGGEPFVPAALARRRAMADAPAHLGLKTFTHPALALLADAAQSDADRALVTACWTLDVDQKDQAVSIGGRMDTGDPFLAERRVGKGFVAVTAVALDRRESNLPSLKCFVPLVHELAYYLAAPTMAQTNVRPGSEFIVELPWKSAETAQKERERAKRMPLDGQAVEVLTPSDQRAAASVAATDAGLRVVFPATYEPGLYHVVLPPKAAEHYSLPPAGKKGLPFVVLGDPEESRLAALTDADLQSTGKFVPIFRAETTSHMISAVTGQVPGEEMWKYLAVALAAALVAEIGLTRWIAVQRRMHMIETVSFGPATVDAQTFRERARSLLAVPNQSSEPQP